MDVAEAFEVPCAGPQPKSTKAQPGGHGQAAAGLSSVLVYTLPFFSLFQV